MNMNKFQQALAALKMADLSFIAPNPQPAPSPPRKRKSSRRKANSTTDADIPASTDPPASIATPSPTPNNNVLGSAAGASSAPASTSAPTHSLPSVEPKLPVFIPAAKQSLKVSVVDAASNNNTASAHHRTRQFIEHEWPPVGTIVSGNYFGTIYRAEVVKANKQLKSGRQLKILNGPLKGIRFDSFTKALLDTTAKQREENNLGRRQATNGWNFWKPETSTPTTTATPGKK